MVGQKNDLEQRTRSILALFMGCGLVERHLEMTKPTKKVGRVTKMLTILFYGNSCVFFTAFILCVK